MWGGPVCTGYAKTHVDRGTGSGQWPKLLGGPAGLHQTVAIFASNPLLKKHDPGVHYYFSNTYKQTPLYIRDLASGLLWGRSGEVGPITFHIHRSLAEEPSLWWGLAIRGGYEQFVGGAAVERAIRFSITRDIRHD